MLWTSKKGALGDWRTAPRERCAAMRCRGIHAPVIPASSGFHVGIAPACTTLAVHLQGYPAHVRVIPLQLVHMPNIPTRIPKLAGITPACTASACTPLQACWNNARMHGFSLHAVRSALEDGGHARLQLPLVDLFTHAPQSGRSRGAGDSAQNSTLPYDVGAKRAEAATQPGKPLAQVGAGMRA